MMSAQPHRVWRSSHPPGSAAMLLMRWLVLMCLLLSGVAFVFYMGTGQRRYLRLGWVVLKWTLVAAALFFAVLIIERL